MAMFEINDEDTWLPTFAQGKGLKAEKVRLHLKDGTRVEVTIPPSGDRSFEVTDERAIRHLEADPRYTRVS